jgi:branched-chain amino acid transport system ATP-binding protein
MSDTANLSQTEPLLRVQGLSAGYGGMHALHDASLEIRKAEIVALVGSNGAGKTTLLRALSRTIASTGRVTFNGHDLTGLAPDQVFAIGLVQLPEGRQLFDRMTVQDNMLMGAYRRKDKSQIDIDLERVYAMFPTMKERRQQLAGSMSGGEQQMCAMGRALMARPTLMMIDEMSLGLAPAIVDQVMDVLGAIRNEGTTVLLVEQDVQLALAGSDRGYVLETGRIVHAGLASDLIDDPAVRHAYLGL